MTKAPKDFTPALARRMDRLESSLLHLKGAMEGLAACVEYLMLVNPPPAEEKKVIEVAK